MQQSGYTAALGLSTIQKRLDNIGANLANVNTMGYKYIRTDFKDVLYQQMQRPVQPQADLDLNRGHGLVVSGISHVFTPGMFIQTERETDLYINGDGFFAIQDSAGDKFYTRDGRFTKSIENGGTYLVNMDGAYVLDDKGQKIKIEGDTLKVGDDCTLINAATDKAYGKIGIYNFNNPKGLLAVGNSLFAQTEASGKAAAVDAKTKVSVVQKALEGSNVNLANEFTKLIRTQRSFSLTARALSTSDKMDEMANSLR